MRTALALFLTGVALEALNPPVDEHFRLIGAIFFVGLGLTAAVYGYVTWASTERALRRQKPLPGLLAGGIVAIGISVVIIIVVVGAYLL